MIGAIRAIKVIGWMLTGVAMLLIGIELLTRGQPFDLFDRLVFAVAMVGCVYVGKWVINFVQVSLLLICVAWASEP